MGTRKKLLQFLRPDPAVAAAKSPSPSESDDDEGCSSSSPPPTSPSTAAASPYAMSPWTQLPGLVGADADTDDPRLQSTATGLLGSLIKEGGGHVYSLAAAGDLLYTGTDSRNVRVWRGRRELGGFRAGSGLVKAIVVAPAPGRTMIYTGHQDGKVRVWQRLDETDDECVRHRRVGSLPRARDAAVATSLSLLRPGGGRRRAAEAWPRHADAVSCLSLDAAAGLLYSGSWDRTVRVWRLADARCLEALRAHDDAVNAVAAAGFDALLFTGSADGTVKVWRRGEAELHKNKKGSRSRRATRHALERVLRRPAAEGKDGGGAVTAIAVCAEARVVYVGSSDGAVTHWRFPRPGEGGEVREGAALRGHRMAVLCLAVAGRVVASGAADRTISVWRREKAGHARVAVLNGHTGPVKCLAVDEEHEEDGERWVVYSGSLDGSVKVWRVAMDGSPCLTAPTHLWKGTMAPLTPARSSWAPGPTKRGVDGEWPHDARARV